MAEVVSDFPDHIPSHGNNIYPWSKWLDGQVWKLVRGVDFQCKPTSMRMAAVYASNRRRGTVRFSVNKKSDTVYLQFIPEKSA